MKNAITLVLILATFIGSFLGANWIIHSMSDGIKDETIRTLTRVILWILSFGTVCMISAFLAWLVGESADAFLTPKRRKKPFPGWEKKEEVNP